MFDISLLQICRFRLKFLIHETKNHVIFQFVKNLDTKKYSFHLNQKIKKMIFNKK